MVSLSFGRWLCAFVQLCSLTTAHDTSQCVCTKRFYSSRSATIAKSAGQELQRDVQIFLVYVERLYLFYRALLPTYTHTRTLAQSNACIFNRWCVHKSIEHKVIITFLCCLFFSVAFASFLYPCFRLAGRCHRRHRRRPHHYLRFFYELKYRPGYPLLFVVCVRIFIGTRKKFINNWRWCIRFTCSP